VGILLLTVAFGLCILFFNSVMISAEEMKL